MKQAIPGLEGQPSIRQYPGGASNLTYQVDYGDQSYVLRRPPFGKIAKSAHDMLREARVMQALKLVPLPGGIQRHREQPDSQEKCLAPTEQPGAPGHARAALHDV